MHLLVGPLGVKSNRWAVVKNGKKNVENAGKTTDVEGGNNEVNL